mgnify:FL=1
MASLWRTYKKKYSSKEGTIVIVDISGFTKLVYNTELNTGRDIILKLLSTIIEKNRLGLNISEIEGDAVLFYKFGSPPSHEDILEQFELMLNAFIKNLNKINITLDLSMELSLKMIVHHGSIAQYQIGTFRKLYGRTVTEAHFLLKNTVDSTSYVLMTNDFLKTTGINNNNYNVNNLQCDILRGIKKLCYRFYDYSPKIVLTP